MGPLLDQWVPRATYIEIRGEIRVYYWQEIRVYYWQEINISVMYAVNVKVIQYKQRR